MQIGPFAMDGMLLKPWNTYFEDVIIDGAQNNSTNAFQSAIRSTLGSMPMVEPCDWPGNGIMDDITFISDSCDGTGSLTDASYGK